MPRHSASFLVALLAMPASFAAGCRDSTPGNNGVCQSAHSVLLTGDLELGFATEKLDASTGTCDEIQGHLRNVALTLKLYREAIDPFQDDPDVRRLIDSLSTFDARDLLFTYDSNPGALSPESRATYKANFARVTSLVRQTLTACPVKR